MKPYILNRNSLVLVVLVLLTLTSWWVGQSQPINQSAFQASGIFMLVVAFIKVRLVIRQFMEVRHAPQQLRWVCDGWLLAAIAGTVSAYLGVFAGF